MHGTARRLTLVLLAVLLAAGCAPPGAGPAPSPTVSEAAPAPPSPAPVATVPPVVDAEVARTVLDTGAVTSTAGAAAAAGTRYVLRAGCSASEDATVRWTVRQGDEVVTRVETPCDGEVQVTSVGDATVEGEVSVTLDDDARAVSTAWAVVVPEA